MRDSVEWPTRDPLAHRTVSTPARTALVDATTNQEWTFRALDCLVDGLAARLGGLPRETGTGRVALLASTRVGFVVAVHGVWRSGRTLVPLNVELTGEELDAQITQTDPDVLVCESATESRAVSLFDGPVASLDEPTYEGVRPFQPADEPANAAVEPAAWQREDDALVMFTSGTTGHPKGVRLTLGNLVASATASAFRLGVAPGDRWLCCLPTYHMGGLSPIVRTALYGTTLVLQPSFDAERTARVLDAYDVTGVSFVPTMLHRLLETDWTPPETLETVLLGGAPAGESLVEAALGRGVPVFPTYGMTETASQIATATPAQADDRPGTVGQPLMFTEVTVVDEEGDPLPAGETGELVVDGPTVTPGYLREEQTASAFGEYGLRTGDIGRRDDDGRLWILGRADDSIVTGGENVHAEAVAEAIRAHPDVADVAVVGLPDEEWGERVAALVVPDDETLTVEDVDAIARERLAAHKVPKTVGIATSLPRTPSGTVDRAAVRELLRE
jgi:O-succinylbenzoic acid--CoA ligase